MLTRNYLTIKNKRMCFINELIAFRPSIGAQGHLQVGANVDTPHQSYRQVRVRWVPPATRAQAPLAPCGALPAS